MITLIRSETFDRWLQRLRDKTALIRILARLRNVGEGNFGDVKTDRRRRIGNAGAYRAGPSAVLHGSQWHHRFF